MQVLPATVVTALKNADRAAYEPLFLGTWTSTDPDFFPMAKGLIRDRLVIQFPGGVPSDRTKGIKILQDLWKRYGTVKEFDASYWEGVVVGMIMERAFIRAKEKYGRIDAATINRAMEGFRNEDFGGLVPPVTYTATDHGASFTARMVRVREAGVPSDEFLRSGEGKDPDAEEIGTSEMKAYRGQPRIFARRDPASRRAELDVSGLTLQFGGVTALNDVGLHVDTGELVAVIGPNGAGKTSLMNCITGFYRPQRGRIRFNGRDTTPARAADESGSYTFQNIDLPAYVWPTRCWRHMHCRYLMPAAFFTSVRRDEVRHARSSRR